MRKLNVTDFFIYRWRYQLGYGFLGLLLIGLLLFAAIYVPNGLAQSEIDSVIISDGLSLGSPASLIVENAPFHLLQKASLTLFGVSNLSIKLPSLILSLATAVCLIFLLRRWFKPGIAVLASVIAVATGQFLLVAQTGSAGIMHLFWPILLLLLATLIARQIRPRTLWKVIFFISMALSLYTPLSLYIIIALGVTIIWHPHLRYLLKQLSKLRLLASVIISAAIVAPLVWQIIQEPSFGLSLLGVPNQWPDLLANLQQLGQELFGFWLSSSASSMIPIFGMASVALILLGIYCIAKDRATVKGHLVIIWSLCLLPVLIINPEHTSIAFVPLVLLLATGINMLLRSWYGLFPFNPYARIAGLIPIIVLVGGMVTSGIDRYVYGYHYIPTAVQGFSQDLQLLPDETSELVVDETELDFYQVVANHRDDLDVSTEIPGSDDFTMTRLARQSKQPSRYSIDRIVTSGRSLEADRFYVYKKTDN